MTKVIHIKGGQYSFEYCPLRKKFILLCTVDYLFTWNFVSPCLVECPFVACFQSYILQAVGDADESVVVSTGIHLIHFVLQPFHFIGCRTLCMHLY